MITRENSFFSDSLKLDSRLWLPDGHDGQKNVPLVVACSGFTGLHQIHPERFARWLCRRGYACFAFDYRGHGTSEGPRNRVVLEEQVRDIRHGVTVAQGLPGIDRDNVFLLGWAMGGGLVIDAARELEGLAGVCALNGLYDGADFQQWHRGANGVAELRRRITQDRLSRATTGTEKHGDPFDIYPLDEVTREYVTAHLETYDDYESSLYSFVVAESLMRWSVLPAAPDGRVPLFLAHGEENRLHPPRQAAALAKAYGGPVHECRLEGAGHTEWMHDDDPTFKYLCDELSSWLEHRTSS